VFYQPFLTQRVSVKELLKCAKNLLFTAFKSFAALKPTDRPEMLPLSSKCSLRPGRLKSLLEIELGLVINHISKTKAEVMLV